MNTLQSKVEDVLNIIRPHLLPNCGGVEYVRFEQDTRTLVLRMTGNCADCPLTMMTLRGGIERFILKYIPQVRRVEKE